MKKFQNIIIVIVVIVIAFIAYSYFFTGKQEGPLVEQSVSTATPADQDLITLLLQLKGITLDESIFSDGSFRSLQDFGQALVPEPVGRVNPFAPLGNRAPANASVNQPAR